jgi:hypothetical protein
MIDGRVRGVWENESIFRRAGKVIAIQFNINPENFYFTG